MNATVPEREVIAIRTDGPHDHVIGVKFADGTTASSADVIAAINAHEAHYVMRLPNLALPILLRVQQCPDCAEEVLYA